MCVGSITKAVIIDVRKSLIERRPVAVNGADGAAFIRVTDRVRRS